MTELRFVSLCAQLHTHEIVEVCAKILYQVELQRNTLEQMWGFSVEAELIENSDRQDELCCYVSRVEDKSVAMQNGKHLLSRTTRNENKRPSRATKSFRSLQGFLLSTIYSQFYFRFHYRLGRY